MRREVQKEGAYVYPWLTHVDVWQKPTQFCKAIILQLKKRKKEISPRRGETLGTLFMARKTFSSTE